MSIPKTSSGYEYYACDWIIAPLHGTQLHNLIQIALDLGCQIIAQDGRRTEQGYFMITFVIRVPNRQTLSTFVEMAGSDIGLTDWHLRVCEPDYLQGLGMWHFESIAGFVSSSRQLGDLNDQLRKRLASQNPA